MSKKYLISGGGTGGHIFPALSIANALRRREPDCSILYVGALGRMEMERVPAAGYEIVGLPVAGFDRRRLWRNVSVLFKLWKSLRIARRTLKQFAPDAVIGVGGYASGPVLKQAQKMGHTHSDPGAELIRWSDKQAACPEGKGDLCGL